VTSLFRNRLFLSVVAGHFTVDLLSGGGPVLLAVLAGPLGLTNAQIGLTLTLYTFAASLSQPPFGWLADHVERRPIIFAGIGVLWMAIFFGAVAFSPSWMLLQACFLLAALGSGLFHPIATAHAAVAHRARAGSVMAIFFFFGQLGLAFGPSLGGLLFGIGGRFGVLPLCVAALLPVGLLLTAPAAPPVLAGPVQPSRSRTRTVGLTTAAFIVLVALRSSIQASYTAFLPKLFADRGWSPAIYGALAGTFLFSAAIGNIVAGAIADRRGMRAAIVLPMLFGVPAGLICLWAPTPLTAFVASALVGLLIGGQHSVLVNHAQRLLPARQSFAAGLILGFTFAAGGVGTWLIGLAADQIGLLAALQAITLVGLPTALLALTLPGRALVAPPPALAEASHSS
jgi:FSR family fosmidomycin resistance protein-like MFS transporter